MFRNAPFRAALSRGFASAAVCLTASSRGCSTNAAAAVPAAADAAAVSARPDKSVASATANAAANVAASVLSRSAFTLDPATVDPHKLMLVTTQYLNDPRRSRPAAQRLLETIEARLDDLPVVFLADVVAGNWPAGMITDSLRVAMRRRIAKGVLDLNGNDVARVFVAWSKPQEQSRDVALFKRLGKLIAFHINDIREASLISDLLVSISRSGLKPPPGFLALLARRAVALDRRSPLTVKQAMNLMSMLDKHGALDNPTATALINRVVVATRAEVERVVAARARLPNGSTATETTTPAAAAPSRVNEDIAKATGLSEDVVSAAVEDEDVAPATSAVSAVTTAVTPVATQRYDEPRDTRWPLSGAPMSDASLTSAEAEAVLAKLSLTQRRIFALLAIMQDKGLTSLLYSRPLVALVLPSVHAMHPLDALRFVRDGGMRRIVSQRLATAIASKLRTLDLDFATRVSVLAALTSYRKHLLKQRAKEDRSPISSDEPEDVALTGRMVKEVLAALETIDSKGLHVKPLLQALESLVLLSEHGMPELHASIIKVLPNIVHRFRHLVVETGTVTVGQCDGILELLAKLRYEDATDDVATIKATRQQAEMEGRVKFECKLTISKQVFKEMARLNGRLMGNGEKLVTKDFEDFFRLLVSRHPMSVLEALYSYEHAFPKTLSPSLKREIGKALVIRLAPTSQNANSHRAVPLTAEEWPRFVELLRTCGPESVVTAPSVWVFVQERNAELGGNPEIHKYAGEMLTIFDRRR